MFGAYLGFGHLAACLVHSLLYRLDANYEITINNKIGQKRFSISPIFRDQRGSREPYQACPRLDRERSSAHRTYRFHRSFRLGLCIAKHAGAEHLARGIAIGRVQGP
jgi:hypothetical protein